MPRRRAQVLADALRVHALAECALLQRELDSPKDLHASVHAARKSVRRLRALLALGEKQWADAETADRALARLGDSLSLIRDAHVLVVTAQKLASEHDQARWAPALDRLTLRRNARVAQALARDPGFQRRCATAGRVARRLAALSWEELSPERLRHSLKRSVRRADKAARQAQTHPDPDHLHRWRRRVRRLRMQLEALAVVAPHMAGKAGPQGRGKSFKALHALGDRLGDQHDELMLRNVLRRMRDLPGRAALTAQLSRAAAADPPRH